MTKQEYGRECENQRIGESEENGTNQASNLTINCKLIV